MSSRVAIALGCLFVVGACGDDDRPATDGGMGDAGATDAGRRDTGARDAGSDAGPADPCVADEDTAGATVGCNGAPVGPAADDTFGGACDYDDTTDPGSCGEPGAYCDETHGDMRGQCLLPCTPTSGSYVSTGGCPTGSRCFDFGGGDSWCYADCIEHTDCPSGLCAYDGSCLDPDPCVADEAGAASTVGCNGAAPGAQASNELGGTCTPDASDGPGTCTDPEQYCEDLDGDGTGQCIIDCFSTGAAYVSDGYCPDGFRCIDRALDEFGYCYADCSAPADCASGACGTDSVCGS